jgi:hypothetical protein
MFRRVWRDIMHFPRLAIAVVAVSMSVVAQTPQRSSYAYFCPSELNMHRNPFLRSASFEPSSSTLLHSRMDWRKLTPPREFRPHDLTALDTMGVNLHFITSPFGCVLVHIDEKGRIH